MLSVGSTSINCISELSSLFNLEQPVPKMVFLARSYGRHALELGNEIPTRPLYFLKSPSSLLAPGQPVVIPSECDIVHYEAETAVLIGKRLSHASAEEALQAIQGWTILNDVTARSAQSEDGGRFTRAKGYSSFCPISTQCISTLEWDTVRIQGWLNGHCVQDAPLTDMIFTPGQALSSISSVMTLNPGDLVSFGTPAGVGPLQVGDEFEVRLCTDLKRATADPSEHPILIKFSHGVVSKDD